MTTIRECCGGKSKSVLKGVELKLPQRITIPEYLRQFLVKNPDVLDSPAVLAGDGKTVAFTFRQLDSFSTKLAKALRQYLGFWTSNSPDGDLLMAFCLPVSESIPVLILAILKLGASFISFPTTYAEQHIVKIVGVTRPMIVITESSGPTKARYECVSGLLTVVGIDEIWKMAETGGFDDLNEVFPLETLIRPCSRMASIVYTPGTMDQPLAVRIGHKEILNKCLWQYKMFPYQEKEVVCIVSALEDVESITEILAPILAGVTLHLVPRKIVTQSKNLVARIRDAKITRITVAPPMLASILDAPDRSSGPNPNIVDNLGNVKFWTICGDALSPSLVERFFNLMSPTVTSSVNVEGHDKPRQSSSKQSTILVHSYGSTEVASDVTVETFENLEDLAMKCLDGKVSIGRPIANTIIYIVDEEMRLVDEGVIGEICVAGASVASGGYVTGSDPDDTERFSVNPFTKRKAYTTIYQTEDFGRIVRNKDGVRHLLYEGRTEFVAKVNGKMVDLRDIMKAVNDTKLVEQCSVLCYQPGKEDQAVVAYCKLLANVTEPQLEKKLRRVITEQDFFPRIFLVNHFNYLPSGRLDKHKLFKQFRYETYNAPPEEWEPLQLVSAAQKSAGKVFFATIALYTSSTQHEIIAHRNDTMWSLGVTSLNALSIFLKLREKGFLIDIDNFLNPDLSLMELMLLIKPKSKNDPANDYTQQGILIDLPEEIYGTRTLRHEDKSNVLGLLCHCYAKRNEIFHYTHMTQDEFARVLDANWKNIMKDNLSMVTVRRWDLKLVGVVITMDAHRKCKVPSNCSMSMKYIKQLTEFSEGATKEHIVWKKKGMASQLYWLGTADIMSPVDNILVTSQLIQATKLRAKHLEYNGSILSCVNPLVKDLCEGIFYSKVLEEVVIHKFQARDNTKPFRLAAEYQTLKVFYDSF